MKVIIHDDFDSTSEAADALTHIADLLNQGYTSGYYPGWDTAEEAKPSREVLDLIQRLHAKAEPHSSERISAQNFLLKHGRSIHTT